ncbi:hypothetical protein [Numidum massiliense]
MRSFYLECHMPFLLLSQIATSCRKRAHGRQKK